MVREVVVNGQKIVYAEPRLTPAVILFVMCTWWVVPLTIHAIRGYPPELPEFLARDLHEGVPLFVQFYSDQLALYAFAAVAAASVIVFEWLAPRWVRLGVQGKCVYLGIAHTLYYLLVGLGVPATYSCFPKMQPSGDGGGSIVLLALGWAVVYVLLLTLVATFYRTFRKHPPDSACAVLNGWRGER